MNHSFWCNFVVIEGFGGRNSDRQIIERTNLIDLMEEGDGVRVDEGFTIEDKLEKSMQYSTFLFF